LHGSAALDRQQQNSKCEDDNADPAVHAKHLAEPERRQRRRHEWRGTAGDRINLAEVAEPVGFRERKVVHDMDRDRRDDVRPGRRRKHAGGESERRNHQAGGESDERGRRDRLEPELQQRVPARMESRCREHSEEDE
jgi:hypothetical protein